MARIRSYVCCGLSLWFLALPAQADGLPDQLSQWMVQYDAAVARGDVEESGVIEGQMKSALHSQGPRDGDVVIQMRQGGGLLDMSLGAYLMAHSLPHAFEWALANRFVNIEAWPPSAMVPLGWPVEPQAKSAAPFAVLLQMIEAYHNEMVQGESSRSAPALVSMGLSLHRHGKHLRTPMAVPPSHQARWEGENTFVVLLNVATGFIVDNNRQERSDLRAGGAGIVLQILQEALFVESDFPRNQPLVAWNMGQFADRVSPVAAILGQPLPLVVIQTIFDFLVEMGFEPNVLSQAGVHPLLVPVMRTHTELIQAVGRHFDMNLIPTEPSSGLYVENRPSLLAAAIMTVRGDAPDQVTRVRQLMELLVSLGANPQRGSDDMGLNELVRTIPDLVTQFGLQVSRDDVARDVAALEDFVRDLQSRSPASGGVACAENVN